MLTWNHLPLPTLLQLPDTLEFPGCTVDTPRPEGDQQLSIGGEEGERTENMGMCMGCLQTYVPRPSKSSRKEG